MSEILTMLNRDPKKKSYKRTYVHPITPVRVTMRSPGSDVARIVRLTGTAK